MIFKKFRNTTEHFLEKKIWMKFILHFCQLMDSKTKILSFYFLTNSFIFLFSKDYDDLFLPTSQSFISRHLWLCIRWEYMHTFTTEHSISVCKPSITHWRELCILCYVHTLKPFSSVKFPVFAAHYFCQVFLQSPNLYSCYRHTK